MQQRRRGLLSRVAPVAPLTPEATAPLTPAMPDMSQLSTQPLEPFAPAKPFSVELGRLRQGISSIEPQTWFQMAGGLLDRAEGDATWGQALGGIGTALQGQQDRTLQKEEIDYVRGERGRQTEERARQNAEFQRIINDPTVDPTVKAALRAAGASQMGNILGTQVMSAGDRARIEYERERGKVTDAQWAQEMQQRRTEGALNRAAQSRGLATEFGMGRYFQSQDAQLLGQQTALSAQIQSVGLPALLNVQQSIQQAYGLTGRPIDAKTRVTLGRMFGTDEQGRAALETWRAQVLTPALESMRGLGAMTEKEFEAAMTSFANPDMTIAAAETLINQRVTEARRRIATADAAQRFAREAGGITGVNNPAGQNFGTFLADELERQGLGGATPAPATVAPAPASGRNDPGPIGRLIDEALGVRQPGSRVTPQQLASIPVEARRAMMQRMNDPAARAAFDQQYGAGSAEALRRAAGR